MKIDMKVDIMRFLERRRVSVARWLEEKRINSLKSYNELKASMTDYTIFTAEFDKLVEDDLRDKGSVTDASIENSEISNKFNVDDSTSKNKVISEKSQAKDKNSESDSDLPDGNDTGVISGMAEPATAKKRGRKQGNNPDSTE